MWQRCVVARSVLTQPARRAAQLSLRPLRPSLVLKVASNSAVSRLSRHFCSHGQKTPIANGTAGSFTDVPGVETGGEKFVMLYTCGVCETRSAKTISKHAYYRGVVLVRCPKCENLHLIADRLGWFEDESTDVESLLKAKGETVCFVTHENVLELTDRDITGDSKE